MESVANHGPKLIASNATDWEALYKPLPFLFFGLLIIWITLVGIWSLNTWSKRQWQTSNLQWILTVVPVLKALVLGLSFAFWYSCLHLGTCSFWVAFGVFVTRIFFETACFISFLLISHGYCIMHEQLSISERRSIAGLGSLLYLTLTGYKAAVPQFAVLVVLIYLVLLYVIFLHVSRNLALLREQLQVIQSEGVHMMHTALYTKYTMFKKFQAAMLMMVVAEVLMHAKADGVANEYWIRLLVREWTEIAIFFYIGWTFRAREITPFFTVIPTLHSGRECTLPPIYSIEMNEKDFNTLSFKEWHIGVPMSLTKGDRYQKPMLVIVQNPSVSESLESSFHTSPTTFSSSTTTTTATTPSCVCEQRKYMDGKQGGGAGDLVTHQLQPDTEVSSVMMVCDHRKLNRGRNNSSVHVTSVNNNNSSSISSVNNGNLVLREVSLARTSKEVIVDVKDLRRSHQDLVVSESKLV